MSSEYTPDVWRVVQIELDGGERHQRVLAGWYGGYASGDSWKLSSGIIKTTMTPNPDGTFSVAFLNSSGSIYYGHENNWRFSGYTSGIFEHYRKQIEEQGGTMVDVGNTIDFDCQIQ